MSTAIKLYLSGDATSRALGADAIARAVTAEAARRGIAVELVRNGSRGMFWLEPLVEVGTRGGPHRLRSGARRPTCRACSTPAFCTAARTRCASGAAEDIPCLTSQERLTFARVGIIDPAQRRRLRRARRLSRPRAARWR